MKVTAILKGRIDSNGQRGIYIRINHGDKRAYQSAGLKVSKSQFKKGKVVDHPKAVLYNDEIKKLIIQHQASNIDGLQPKQKKIDFYKFLQECIDEWETWKKDGTMRVYKSLGEILKEYRPHLYLHEIDLAFLNKWKTVRFKKVEPNTVWSNLKSLRAVVREAKKRKLISEYPFENFTMPEYKDTLPVYLEKEELQAMEKLLEDVPQLAHYGWWFLIASYTAFRLGDIVLFDAKKHIKKERIVVHTDKEGTIVSIPFTDKLRGYFEKINYAPLGCAEETYREKIKLIAARAGVTKEISTHTARHTAAVNMASAGLSIEVVAKILGHKDLRSTTVYFKIVDKKLDEDYKVFTEWMGD